MAIFLWAGDGNGWQAASTAISLMQLAPASPATEVNLVQQLFQAFVLGIVQGLTEFLPISSTAHLQVFTQALHWESVGGKPFIATIQFGSIVAVLIYFWKDITTIITGGLAAIQQKDWQREEWKILVGIAVGTLPILVGGLLLKQALNDDKSAINSMTVIACISIVMSLLMGLAEKIGNRKRNFDHLEIQDGILMGLGQMIALVPGASRSGSTITTGLFLGLERATAARFSFLLGIPALVLPHFTNFLSMRWARLILLL